MQTLGLTPNAQVQIISAYAASNQQLPAVAAPPAWVVIGAFYMPARATARLEAVGLVSVAPNIVSVRLFDVAGTVPVTGSETPVIDGTVDERVLSGVFELTGGNVYQVQAQAIGAAGFGIIRTASPINA